MKRFLLIALLAVAVAAADPEPEMSAITAESVGADLVANKDSLISFSFDAAPGNGGNTIVDATLEFSKGTESFVLESQGGSNDRYDFVLPVQLDDLTVGEWSVQGIAVDALGRTNHTEPIAFTATAPEVEPYVLLVNGKESADSPTVLVSPSRSPVVTIIDHEHLYLLKEIRWKTNETWRTMTSNILLAKDFDASEGTLNIELLDRVNRVSSYNVPFIVDQEAPEHHFHFPDPLYSVINNTIEVEADENMTLTYGFNGGQGGLTVKQGEEGSFNLSVETPGLYTFAYTTRDDLGNTEDHAMQLTFIRPTTSVELASVELSATELLLGDVLHYNATWTQGDSAAEVFVMANVTGALEMETEFSLLQDSEFVWSGNMKLAPGQYQLLFNSSVASDFNQTDGLALSEMVEVEVFIGKTIHGNQTYFIRTNAQGFPSEAVNGDETYPLQLRREGAGLVYEFNGIFWDSNQTVTTIAPTVEEEKQETPAPLLVVVVGLALAAFRRR